MAIEAMPNPSTLRQAFEHEIYSSDGAPLSFGSLFNTGHQGDERQPSTSILVIFIRHFFCGNCQEYIRRLSSPDSPFHPSRQQHAYLNFSKPTTTPPPSVVIIGPGSPSLLASYSSRTQCAFPVYADPSTQLYDILGMHRTLSMGAKSPEYIQHSLFSGAVKSAWQIVKRVGNGDAMDGGDWQVNGGEFLFVWTDPLSTTQHVHAHARHRSRSRSRSKSNSPPAPATRSQPSASERVPSSATGLIAATSRSSVAGSCSSTINSTGKWETRWCHRMLNSRDHTELADLQYHASASVFASLPSSSRPGSRANSPSPLRSILVNGNTNTDTDTKPHQPRHSTKHHSKTRSLTRSYSSDCLGSCPGPDVPKSHEEALLNQALYSARAHARPSSKTSQRTTVVNRPRSSSRTQHHPQRSKSVASTTRPESKATQYTLAEEEEEQEEEERDGVQPRKSFTTTLASRVGMVIRSKSLSSAKSHSHHYPRGPRTALLGEDDIVAADGEPEPEPAEDLLVVESSGSGTKRSISSLIRSASKKDKNKNKTKAVRRPQTATPTPVPGPGPVPVPTSASSQHERSDSAVSVSLSKTSPADENGVPAPMPESTKETKRANPISSLRPSLSLSRKPKPKANKTTTTTTRTTTKLRTKTKTRQRNTIEMDDNGIMLVDGVEFVNVISLKARVDRVDSGFSETTTASGVHVDAHADADAGQRGTPPISLPIPMPISLPTAAVQG